MKNTKWIMENYFAHRGLHNEEIPENSIASFLHAVENGYDIELDIRITKDNKLVVIHDNNLTRLCGKDICVEKSLYNEISSLLLKKSNETIPLLSSVLEVLPRKTKLLIELKPSRRNKKFVKLFLEIMEQDNHQYAVHSFDPRIVYLFKKNAPKLIRGQIAKDIRLQNGKRIMRSLTSCLFVFTKPDFINYKFIDLPYNKLDKYKRKGMLILSYTAKSVKDMEFVKSRYDNAVFENYKPK